MQKSILYLSAIWPEWNATAAGVRSQQLLTQWHRMGYTVYLGSAGKNQQWKKKWEKIGIIPYPIVLNQPTIFKGLLAHPPDAVIYDRFYLEEQYSWQIREFFPQCRHIIDTQDLHSLRLARQKDLNLGKDPLETSLNIEESLTLRELSAFYRADYSLFTSTVEMDILDKNFCFPKDKMGYLPLFYQDSLSVNSVSFSERKHCCFIGNYRHLPNLDAVKWFSKKVWPLIKEKLSGVQLHLYGSYLPAEVKELSNNEVVVKGQAPEVISTLQKYRINFAPLRFGAGLKGKVLEASRAGTPTLGSPIALEGFHPKESWKDATARTLEEWIEKSVLLYFNKDSWEKFSTQSKASVSQYYLAKNWLPELKECVEGQKPKSCITTNLLRFQNNQSAKFLAKSLIERKRKSFLDLPISNTKQAPKIE